MTQPIRPLVYAATEFPKDAAQMTLRDALQWFKKAMSLKQVNELEANYLNERWAVLCDAIGEREGVPTGSLSYYLAELAQAEVNLSQVGDAEAAGAYPSE